MKEISSVGGQCGSTSQRILVAAEELFAEKGFDAVSVREITSMARCNLAAVNYHFGSKDNLYKEVFLRFLSQLRANKLSTIDRAMAQPGVDIEKLLQAFCDNFLETNCDSRFGKLHTIMRREEINPRLSPELFFGLFRKPVMARLAQAFVEILPGMSLTNSFLCVESVVSQLLHLCRLSATRKQLAQGGVVPELIDKEDYIERSLNHIVFFCKAGIEAVAGTKEDLC